jgi:hypothetical protein
LYLSSKMAELINKIERVMHDVNPFGFVESTGGDYYFEAKNMVSLLPGYQGSIQELCMDAFHIYDEHSPVWKKLAAAITELLKN